MKTILTIIGMLIIMATNIKAALVDFDSLWNYDNPAETEQKFNELVPAAKSSGDSGYYAELLTQIARTQGLQQNFDSAHATLDSVKILLESAGDRAHVRYLLERGRVFNSSKKQAEALPLFAEAWEKAKSGHFDNFAVDAAHMMGIAAPADSQMGWNLKALDFAEKSADPKAQKWRGSLYNNIGWGYFDQKKYDNALEMFQKAATFRRGQGNPTEIRVADWCVAKTMRYLGRVEEALEIQQRLQKECEASGEEQDGYVFEELAECLLALNRSEEAVPYFAGAYKLLSKDIWLARDEPARLERLKKLGRVK